eukprot:TRINITY_DN48270_c0_g1_i1.p1 TRINITY_DN48270_c0_g1~~TRINITY_DN48270_c0_g1_i1.p1  ORF type:complete len:366 (+),score=50.18 TRINITY_DN48270_c0_g1_i1:135-1232(+)
MALTAVTPVEPSIIGTCEDGFDEDIHVHLDDGADTRLNLTRPPDRHNELIKVAAVHGPPGILAVLRARRDYGWFVVLGLRAIEVCLSPRSPKPEPSVLRECNPILFAMQMLEMEMIEEVFDLMRLFQHCRDAHRAGLAIIELLIMDDQAWRDEIARKGGVSLLCEIAKQRKDSPQLMCQVMTCMSYLAAEDYIEIMLCQHDALDHVAYVFERHNKNVELVTRASLALLNMTACEPHVEELQDKGALPSVLRAFAAHAGDPHLAIILGGVLANFSTNQRARDQLVENGVLPLLEAAMKLDSQNAVLQVACLKAIVNYSMNVDHYAKMQALGIPELVELAMEIHAKDPGVQRYGNYFQGEYSNCPIL